MKKSHLYFCAYLAALLMLAAVSAKAADVKELFAIDLADYPGKEGRADVLRGAQRCSRRGAQRQQHGAGQVRRGAAEG